jgi:hypothetical protein
LLLVVTLLAIGVGASIELRWGLAGIVTTIVLEALAYRRPRFVREQFDRRLVMLGALLLVAAGIGAGALLAADRVLSFSIGALGGYLCLLVAVGVAEWSSGRST